MGSSSNSQNENFTSPEEESLRPPSSALEDKQNPLGEVGDNNAYFSSLSPEEFDETMLSIEEEAAVLESARKIIKESREVAEELEARKPYRHESAVVFLEQVRALKEKLPSWVRKFPFPLLSVRRSNTKKALSYAQKNSYSDEQLRFSTEEVDNKKSETKGGMRIYRQRERVTLEELREGFPFAGEQFYDLYNAITCYTVDMSILEDDSNLEDWQKTERLAVIRTRKKLVERLCRTYKEEPQEIARFFKFLMSDISIGCNHKSLSYTCADNCLYGIIQHVDDTSPEIFHEYLSDICLAVVENDDIGVRLTKKFAMSMLVEFRDARIVPIIKRFAEDESAILYEEAKLELLSAVKQMPRLFPEPKYDKIRQVVEETKKNVLYERDHPGIWG